MRQADAIADSELRRLFLSEVPEHARIMALQPARS
jgi:hypothetical protein